MEIRKITQIKPAYTAVWHHALEDEYHLIEIKSVADLLNMVIKHNCKVIVNELDNSLYYWISGCGINPDEVDFIITIYDKYIE